MKKNRVVMGLLGVAALVLWLSCGDGVDEGDGQMDTSVIGLWEGVIGPELQALGFDGTRIYTRINGPDSTFRLVSLVYDTASSIQDTTLDMAGIWRLNGLKDSILLIPDTCVLIDTSSNILVPRDVNGVIIPMPINISRNNTTGIIEWMVSFAELLPIAPLLGIDLSGIPEEMLGMLGDSRITLFKRSQ